MDTYMHKTMVSVVSLEKIEIIRSQEFMPSEARLKFLKKMIILGPKTAILGPQFCRILVLGPHFWWSGGSLGPRGPPWIRPCINMFIKVKISQGTRPFKKQIVSVWISITKLAVGLRRKAFLLDFFNVLSALLMIMYHSNKMLFSIYSHQ